MNNQFFLLCILINLVSFPSAGEPVRGKRLAPIREETSADLKMASSAGMSSAGVRTPLAAAYDAKYSGEVNPARFGVIATALRHRGLKPQLTLKHGAPIYSAAWNPTGQSIITGSGDKSAVIWRAYTGEKVHTLKHDEAVFGVAWHPDGNDAITASHDKTACVWDGNTGERKQILNHGERVHNALWSSCGRYVLTGSENALRLWNVKTWNQIKKPMNLGAGVEALKWISLANKLKNTESANMAHSDDRLLVNLDNAEMHTFKMDSEGLIGVRDSKLGRQIKRTMSPDGKFCLKRIDENAVAVCDVRTGLIKKQINLRNFVNRCPIAWTLDSKCIIIQNFNKAHVVDVNSGTIHILEHPNCQFVRSLDLSPDGNRVVTAAEDGNAHIWDVAHLYDEQFRAEYSAVENGELNSEQRMLLLLCDNYNGWRTSMREEICPRCQEVHDRFQVVDEPKPNTSLQELVHNENLPGVTLDECLRVFTTFHPSLRIMMFNAFGLHDAQRLLFEQLKPFLFSVLPNADCIKRVGEYIAGPFPGKEKTVDPQEVALKAKEEQAKTLLDEKEATAKLLFEAIALCNKNNVNQRLNPLTVGVQNIHADNRTPLMELIWRSKPELPDFDVIFRKILRYRGEFNRDAYHVEMNDCNLSAIDYSGRNALMLAIDRERFDYALAIAQKMDSDAQYHKAFKQGSNNQTAFDRAEMIKGKFADNHTFAQLYSILEKHNKELKPDQSQDVSKLLKKIRSLPAKQRRKFLKQTSSQESL